MVEHSVVCAGMMKSGGVLCPGLLCNYKWVTYKWVCMASGQVDAPKGQGSCWSELMGCIKHLMRVHPHQVLYVLQGSRRCV